MSDPRATPDPAKVTEATPARVMLPLTDLNRHPGAQRDRQVLLGERLTILGRRDGHAYVQTQKDSYVGYVNAKTLGPDTNVTHRISARTSHAYSQSDMKSADLSTLHHGSLITVLESDKKFARTTHGYVPVQHIQPMTTPETDPVSVAKRFLGTPYLWGGNSSIGIDCSGLIQAALTACNIPCPGDSDQQEHALGTALPDGTTPQAGDLFFWKGHVALAADATTLIHANAHHMATAFEPLTEAFSRIQTQGDGPVTAHKRLSVSFS